MDFVSMLIPNPQPFHHVRQVKILTSVVFTSRPQLPTSFDRSLVQTLVEDIDKPRSASTLKFGYFARRGHPDFPFDDAMSLISAAIAKEPVGSKRWFYLQDVRGYAIFKTNVLTLGEGIAAYAAIFDAADKAVAADALYPMRVSVAEYAAYIADTDNKDTVQEEPQAKATLLKAWKAYALIAALPMKGRTAPPDFISAFAALDSSDDAIRVIEKTLTNPKVPHSFELLVTGASLVAPKQPEKAISWLHEAKPLLPSPSTLNAVLTSPAINETARFYDLLVDVLQKNNRIDEAIAEQRERIAKVGGGYGPLWVLLARKGDTNGQNAVVAQLKSPTLPGREVLRAAGTMGQFKLLTAPVAGGPEAGADVLQALLLPNRDRTPEEEMQARLWLGSYYRNRKQNDKALEVVTMPEPAQLTGRGRLMWAALSRLRETITVPTPAK